MVVAERRDLMPVKVLISNSLIHLELFENKEGNLFLSSRACKPEGTVYYGVTLSLFCSFLEDSITLQALFNTSPSFFVEINNKEKKVLYSRADTEVKLICGDKTMRQLTNNCPIEVWRA
ncbi:MAG TPA: hypothetical protein VFW07_11600 [Parafilimonas sp.]|nr:hypothetical protein [Parafilimonas sp.]